MRDGRLDPQAKNTARDQIISRRRLMEVLYDCNNILVVTSVSVLVSIVYLDNVFRQCDYRSLDYWRDIVIESKIEYV